MLSAKHILQKEKKKSFTINNLYLRLLKKRKKQFKSLYYDEFFVSFQVL